MKRLVTLISILAFVAAAGTAVAATPHARPGTGVDPRLAGVNASLDARVAQRQTGFTVDKGPALTRSTRSLAAWRCVNSYLTSVYAARWPGIGSWTETYCVQSDYSIPYALYYDDAFFYWSGNEWIRYGIWYEHVTMVGGFSAVDFCYWVPTGGQRTGYFYDHCP